MKSSPVVVLATNNLHKVKEIRSILKRAGLKVQLLTLDSFPKRRPVVENKPTIEGNAAKKAREIAQYTGHLALADDTGLFIKALKGRPGVYSARFAGRGCNYLDNNSKVLRLMKNIPEAKRNATFRTVAALATPTGRVYYAKGKVEGRIVNAMKGKTGFGYDPIFFVPRYGKTYAQMGASLKNIVSHRARAFAQVPKIFKKILRTAKGDR